MKDLDINDDLFDPIWTSDEKPEVLLTVEDDEIKVEKYISEEEQKKLDEAAKEKEGKTRFLHRRKRRGRPSIDGDVTTMHRGHSQKSS